MEFPTRQLLTRIREEDNSVYCSNFELIKEKHLESIALPMKASSRGALIGNGKNLRRMIYMCLAKEGNLFPASKT